MDIHNYLMAVLSNSVVFPAAVLCIAPMLHQLRCDAKVLFIRMAVVCIVSVAGLSYLQCRFDLTPNTVLLPMMIIFFIVYHHSLKVHISKSASIFAYVGAIMSVFANSTNAVDALINPEASAYMLTDENAVIQFTLSTFGTVLLFFPMRKYGSYLIDSLDINRIWYITVLFSGIIMFVNIRMTPEKYETLHTNNVFRVFCTLQLMFITFEILLAVIFYFIVKGLLDAAKREAHARFLEMKENSYIKQQRYIEETARARHDFKQIVRTLNTMASDNDLDGIKHCLNKYAESLPENDVHYYCDNSSVNALLNYYAQAAVSNGISTNWEIDIPGAVRINDLDLCITVGNILDNAIAACCGVTDGDKYIKLTVKLLDGINLCIIAVNSFSGKVRKKDDRYLSTNRKSSGIGLSSVTSIAEQNGGTARFHHEGNEFFSEIIMKAVKADQ